MSGYLVVGPSWVGDMVMAQSLIIALKEQAPDAPVDVIAPAWSAPVARRMQEVREALVLPVKHRELGWKSRRALGKTLRERRYSQAIVMPRSLKSALVPWFAGIPKRTGYRGEWRYGVLNDVREADPRKTVTAARRWMALAWPEGVALPEKTPHPRLLSDAGNQARLIRTLGLRTDKPVVALVPGAEHGSAKRWPSEYFGDLARELAHRDIGVWLLGSPKETAIGEAIARRGGTGVLNLCGRTDLPDVIDLLDLTDAVACNDSGLMHVAAATGVFVVALYGPSSPLYTPPLTDNCRVLYLGLDCSPCFAGECPLGHHNCLRRIAPDTVLDALLSGLPSSAGNTRSAQAVDGSGSASST